MLWDAVVQVFLDAKLQKEMSSPNTEAARYFTTMAQCYQIDVLNVWLVRIRSKHSPRRNPVKQIQAGSAK